MKTATLILATLFLTSSPCRAQGWRTYSPPDHSFSVDLPVPLSRVMSFEGEQGTGLEPDQKIGWASCYAAIETTPEDSRFGILVINGRGKFVRLQKRETLLEYLSWLFIADDDELEFLKAPIVVNRNRLTGKEYLYIKGTELFTRGRIFDTGDKIYVVVFVGKNVADLTSQDAETFFNSFRRQNQRRNLQARNRVHIKHR